MACLSTRGRKTTRDHYRHGGGGCSRKAHVSCARGGCRENPKSEHPENELPGRRPHLAAWVVLGQGERIARHEGGRSPSCIPRPRIHPRPRRPCSPWPPQGEKKACQGGVALVR